ncbi:MAG TPA: EVE domain-containing protein [Rheinheimera sp.]|uniref:EVE domain-containing protein n=1 Tax=Rheinheimera sp. TaxID=1869214 RepID=UPI000EEED9D7|nr:EVE domain-containing protein [Rheinheimera sp.]HCU65859.1 EVE domain-containing protein [Rheinheimera sp.]
MAWLFKTEPNECSIDDIAAAQDGVIWEGVRNYQARNFLRDQVQLGDLVLIHHSSCKQIGLAGLAKVSATAFADPSQFQPRSPYYDAKASAERWPWYAVQVQFVEKFRKIITMDELRTQPALAQMQVLKKGNRLSVMPVTKQEMELVLFLTRA